MGTGSAGGQWVNSLSTTNWIGVLTLGWGAVVCKDSMAAKHKTKTFKTRVEIKNSNEASSMTTKHTQKLMLEAKTDHEATAVTTAHAQNLMSGNRRLIMKL